MKSLLLIGLAKPRTGSRAPRTSCCSARRHCGLPPTPPPTSSYTPITRTFSGAALAAGFEGWGGWVIPQLPEHLGARPGGVLPKLLTPTPSGKESYFLAFQIGMRNPFSQRHRVTYATECVNSIVQPHLQNRLSWASWKT